MDRVTHLNFDIELILAQFNATQWLDRYWEAISEENSKVNLVSRETSKDDFKRIVAEALLPFTQFRVQAGSYLDIGSGGGIPSFPILLSGLFSGPVTLYERTRKKAEALSRMSVVLGLSHLRIVPESFGERKLSTTFSLVTLSWVALTPPLCRSVNDVLAPGAGFVYYSRPDFEPPAINMSVYSYSPRSADIHKYFSIITK